MGEPPVDVVDRAVEVVEVPFERCCRRRCPARAYVFAQFATGELEFCAHHGTELWEQINAQAVVVLDMRQVLADEEARR